jgi:hypothetical protein
MQGPPDTISWISEARMLGLCDLPRSTFQSWLKAGLDLADPGGAYGLAETLEIAVLVHARRHLGLEEMAGAWKSATRSGRREEIVRRAVALEEGDRFDLVIQPQHASLVVAESDAELVRAVRHPTAPRPVVVLDIADSLLLVKEGFEGLATVGSRPSETRRGRPRRQAADVRTLPTGNRE